MVSANGFQPETILVTGGAGYIGSHCTLQLLLAGYKVVIVDNLSNSSEEAIKRVTSLAGGYCNNLSFFKADLCVKEQLEMVFLEKRFDAVIHFAGLKAVGESVEEPLRYYCNNVIGTLNLLRLMDAYGCKKLVFSSSATVYGQPKSVPCTEEFPLEALNPYGRTKLYIEQICKDVQKADPEWKIILLRYFNPVAAHPSGTIGEDPKGIPNNLMPFVQQVAVGRRKELTVYGNDYPTRDGTGVRDYIHVMDLVDGHVAALTKIFGTESVGLAVYNLGTGQGTSVLEMVAAFENASGKKIPLKIAGRRAGDSAEIYACTAKAEKELGWKANYGIEEMARDQWNWARKNPWGYQSNENGNSDRLQENRYSDNGLHGNGVKNQENRNGENGNSDTENRYSDNGLQGNGVKNQEDRNGDHGLHGNGNSDNGLHGNGIKNQENGNSDYGLHRNGVKNYF